MAKTVRFYQRLTRPRSGIGTYTSLWLGPDHLLLVTSSGYSESYQRFYFRDIQCLVAADSIRFTVFNAVFGCLLLFCAIPALILTLSGSGVSAWILLPVVPSFLILAWNLYLGRTCNVTMLTGVQTVRLPPLSRFRRTRQAFARLVPLIEAAQAALTPPPLAAPPAATPAPHPMPVPAAEAVPASAQSPDQSDPSASSAQPALATPPAQ